MHESTVRWRKWLQPDVALTILALGAGAGGAVLGSKYLTMRAAAAETDVARRYETRQVVVASTDVPRGATLDPGNLAVRSMPGEFLPPGAVPAERAAEVLGRQLAIDVGPGTPILRAALADRGAAPRLSAVLGPDERAITIAVDELASQAGALRAGDRVDLHYGRRESGDAVIVPLLQQVEILGVGDSFSLASQDGAQRQYATVTLRVPADDAPRVLLAQQAGELSMLLRPAGDLSLLPVTIRSSRELLRRPAARSAPARGVEVLTGGSGERVPERTWLAAGTRATGDAT